MKKTNQIGILLTCVIAYFLLKYIVPYGNLVIYPINLLVTFLHEFGHAAGAILTGGGVHSVEVNSDGSGLAVTSGGWRSITLMGGYIGSAIFGNILLYIGLVQKNPKQSEYTLYVLSGAMLFSGIFWFSDIMSFVILLLLAGTLGILAYKTDYDKVILQFLGVASLAYIIEDFRVGPSSDLSKFSEIFVVIPQSIWMIIWLILVLVLTGFNLKKIFKF